MIRAKEVLSLCENKSFGVLVKELASHLGLDIYWSSHGDRFYFYTYFSLDNQPSSNIPKISNAFYQKYEPKIRLPLKTFEDFCGLKFIVSGYIDTAITFENKFMVEDKKINVSVKLSFPSSNDATLMCVMVDFLASPRDSFERLVNSIPEGEKQKLMSSIVNIFIGYNKLVNNFKDKPVKKTNADW